MPYNDQSFNNMLTKDSSIGVPIVPAYTTNNIVSFEQLGPGLCKSYI